MVRQSRVASWCDRIVEGGWLFAVVLIPSYFNLLSSRHFEPDKATALRAIVLVMLAAAAIRWLDGILSGQRRPAGPPGEGPPLWRQALGFPMALPAILYSLVFLLATAVSILPATSFWGSYQRLQGTYTNLSYVALGAIAALNIRRREQLDRLTLMMVLGSLPAVGYGIVQHFQLDPLPWRGDVVARVASTMGNSIFVAAYLIMVLPIALARGIGALASAQRAEPPGRPQGELAWGAAYLLLAAGALAIVFGAVEFGAVVRTSDLRYWWVYPGALTVAFALFLVPALRAHAAERLGAAVWPGIVTIAYVLLVGASFALGQGPDQAVTGIQGRPGAEWPFWLIGGLALAMAGYGLMFSLGRLAGPPTRLMLRLQGWAMLAISAALLLTIFFTQSRGPWIGGMAGLFVFLTIALVLAWQRARAAGSPRASLWRGLLAAELVLVVVLGGFLAAFNLSDAPAFESLRKVPYIGRMGKLLEVNDGTGLVRRLIWVGDEKAGGAVALIKSDPVRAVVGWGPETMFVAYNRFYPPSLANVESRGASPDRSHEAYLDELINKGVLGLASYLFVLISFFLLARRLIARSDDVGLQVLLAGCIGVVVSHAVEGLTGIPIVATLMTLWLAIAITVAAGSLMGEYGAAAEAAPEPAPAPAEAPARASAAERTRARQRAAQGRAAGGRGAAARPQQGAGAAGLLIYALIAAGTAVAVWSFNVDNVYADMRFQQGQNYTEDPQADLDRYIIGTSYYIDALRMEPDQDFYYLNLGRSLMSIVDIRRQTAGVDLGQAQPAARPEDLLRLQEPADVQQWVLQRSPMQIMSYAEAVLLRAHDISTLNKDHYANLARMYNFWYTRLQRDPAILQKAVDWYKGGTEVAPQDVTILNEYASAIALQGSAARAAGDEASAQARFAEASALIERSAQIDPRYRDTDVRRAEVLRLQGRYAEAVDRYAAILAQNPRALDGQVTAIIDSLKGQPELLRRLRASYEVAAAQRPDDAGSLALIGLISARSNDLPRAAQAFSDVVRLQPQNLEARQNYTLVLSDMLQYRQAAAEADELVRLAQQQGISDQERGALDALRTYLQLKAKS